MLTAVISEFGLAFLDAKERCNARTRHGSFDTNVLEIKKDDLERFLAGDFNVVTLSAAVQAAIPILETAAKGPDNRASIKRRIDM